MKTVLRATALAVVMSCSVGLADGGSGANSTPSLQDRGTALVGKFNPMNLDNIADAVYVIGVVVAYDKIQEYVLAPYVQKVPVLGKYLEKVRALVDIKNR